jgi:8-hydroxy-5-deazaflavin:NADPH oxidoreductase
MSETTAIVGAGNIGSAIARHLVAGGESVIVAAKDDSQAKALADELGPNARASSVEDAISRADAVVLALWLDDTREVIPQQAHLLEGKVVVDPSNPVGLDADGQIFRTLPDNQSAGAIVAGLLPSSAHYVKAFGTFAAETLAASANREPQRAAIFYATDDDVAATTVERLIRAAGFEPLKAGGTADAGRLEALGGDLNFDGEVVDLEQARAALADAQITKEQQ